MKLEIGSNDHFEVRIKEYRADIAGNFSVLYISDLHFNQHSNAITLKMIHRISELDPGIILLGGDYVDHKNDLIHLNTLLQSLSLRKNVFAIAGNHDNSFGVNTIKELMEANNVGWIERSSGTCTINNTTVQIDGTRESTGTGAADFSILCMHQPRDIKRFKDKYNLAFAGHLHGCQFVFWQHNKALYPGRFLFTWNILEKKESDCHYYISKGMGESLPVRFNCARDMILVQVIGNGK